MGQNVKLVAKTLFGLEDVLFNELKSLGALHLFKGQRMVSFEGDIGFIYKANLACRTAIKILKPIHEFEAKDEQAYYNAMFAFDWSELISLENTFAIDATVFSETFTHSKYIALRCKDAIVDQFREKLGSRPNIDTENPDIRINVHIHMHQVTISLDSSGVSLHQRGYRVATSLAPINEVLAAGLLLLAGWDGQCDFLDPMCGSGTILIEAAMIAANIPANLHRKQFAFEKWADWDENLFNTIKESLLKKTKDITCRINGFDMDFQAIKKSKINISNAMLEDFIDVDTQDFFTSSKAKAEKLFILCNPPYDERLSIDTQSFYASIGNTLKKHYTNTEAWLITSNYDAIKSVGLKPSEKIKVFNGALEARLLKYDIYEGSKRNKE